MVTTFICFRIACNYFVLGVERYTDRMLEEALDLLTMSYIVNEKIVDEAPAVANNNYKVRSGHSYLS